jgi:hypothetical protein
VARGRLILGDVIVELDGTLIKNSTDLYRTLDKHSVGQEIALKVMRGENKVDLTLTLDDLKDLPQQLPAGVYQMYPGQKLPPGAVPLPPGVVPYPPGAVPPVVPGEPAPGDEGGEAPGDEGSPTPPF